MSPPKSTDPSDSKSSHRTQVAKLPPGSKRDLFDPYADKKSPWPKIIAIAIIIWIAYAVLNKAGYIYDWTGGRWGDKRETTAEKVEKPAPETKASAATPAPPPADPAAKK